MSLLLHIGLVQVAYNTHSAQQLQASPELSQKKKPQSKARITANPQTLEVSASILGFNDIKKHCYP
jgi:hypothetical protein